MYSDSDKVCLVLSNDTNEDEEDDDEQNYHHHSNDSSKGRHTSNKSKQKKKRHKQPVEYPDDQLYQSYQNMQPRYYCDKQIVVFAEKDNDDKNKLSSSSSVPLSMKKTAQSSSSSPANHNKNNNNLDELEALKMHKRDSCILLKLSLTLALSICLLFVIIYLPIVYLRLNSEYLARYPSRSEAYWRGIWIFNNVLTILILIIGIIGVWMEKVVMIVFTSIALMLTILDSSDASSSNDKITLPLSLISFTSVLLIIYAAKLRCFAEDKMNLANKIQCM